MASVKATFVLNEESARKLTLAAERTGKPKSEVVREAIIEYSDRTDRLTDEERDRMLAEIESWEHEPPTRPQHEVDAELEELRRVRRLPGRLTPVA